jgi:4-amino-4-deoxy-L-arabinose transferase-like glycosyltransferase
MIPSTRSEPDLKTDRMLWIIVAAGLLLRLVWALIVPVEPVSDSVAYLIYAQNLLNHGVYGLAPDDPGAYWPVGTSAVAAATFFVLGDSYAGIVALNIAATAIIMLAVHRLGELWFGNSAAFFATSLVAFWPNLILFTTILSSELYFIAMVMAGLWFWVHRHRPLALLACAVFWGLACYLRPVGLLLPIALCASAFPLTLRTTMVTVLQAAAILLIMLALLLPWAMRNNEVLGEPVLVATNFGPNLWMGNNPDSTGGYMPLPDWTEGMTETERARALGDSAKAYIKSDPLGFIARTAVKAVKLFDRETIGVVWNQAAIERLLGRYGPDVSKLVATGYWYGLLSLTAVGLWQLGRARRWEIVFHPTVVGLLYFTGLHAVIVTGDRYHMPVAGFIALLGGVGLAYLVKKLFSRVQSKLGPT